METELITHLGRLAEANVGLRPETSRIGIVSRLLIREARMLRVVKVRDIEWIDACGNYVEIHAGGKTFLHRATIGGISSRLPLRQFVKMHRSLLVNVAKVREVRTLSKGVYSLVMSSGVELPTNRPLHEIHELIAGA